MHKKCEINLCIITIERLLRIWYNDKGERYHSALTGWGIIPKIDNEIPEMPFCVRTKNKRKPNKRKVW